MIDGLDISSYKKLHGNGLTLPGTVVKGEGCNVKCIKGSGLKILK